MSATGTETPTAIATPLVFFGVWVSSAGATEADDEGVGVADALMIEEMAAGVAGALLDTATATELDSADDVGDAGDEVGDADDNNVEEISDVSESPR